MIDLNDRFQNNAQLLCSAATLLNMVLGEFDSKVVSGADHAEIISTLRSLISEEAEVFMDLGPAWHKTIVTIAITVAKETPSIWNEFTAFEKESFDLIMQAFVYMAKLAAGDGNDYTTGLAFHGGYCKNWSPNHLYANMPQILFAIKYFGSADNVNSLLINFNYETFIQELRAHNLNRTLTLFTTPGFTRYDGTITRSAREILEVGGVAEYKTHMYGCENIMHAGTGTGIRSDFNWWHRSLYQLSGLFGRLAHPGIRDISQDADNNGFKFEYRELHSHDSFGVRESAYHSIIDAILLMYIYVSAHKLGLIDLGTLTMLEEGYIVKDMISEANAYLDFLLGGPYVGISMGEAELFDEKAAKNIGYYLAKITWDNTIKSLSDGR